MQIESPLTQQVLAAHQYQGQRNDCAPITAAMTANVLGNLDIDGERLAQNMNRPVMRGVMPVIRRIPDWATFPWGVVDVLRQYRLYAKWWRLRSFEWLHAHIGGDSLLITITGHWRPLWAHMMVLLAYRDDLGYGFANPAYAEKVLYWLPTPKFEKQWQAFGRNVIEVRKRN
jgi:hypothetical protein